jgi:TPP-dependent pyruvate/acetoin dehydrogenase alpha subunit
MSVDGISNDQRLGWLKTMLIIRLFEARLETLYRDGTLPGSFHSSAGQEASAVGAIAALAPEERITTHFRGIGHCIAKGLELHRIMAELCGKVTGCCRGKGGSMHLSDMAHGILPTSAIVAGGLPLATGSALSAMLFGPACVTMAFFGDGGANQGVFHESLNLAAIWKLPVVYVCENNQYAMSMPARAAMLVENVADRASAYGLPGHVVDGNDVEAVYAVAAQAVSRAREGLGPTLIECQTYRLRGHYYGDADRYRSRDEIQAQRERDPLSSYHRRLLAEGVLADGDYERWAAEIERHIDEALRYGQVSEPPPASDVRAHIYA